MTNKSKIIALLMRCNGSSFDYFSIDGNSGDWQPESPTCSFGFIGARVNIEGNRVIENGDQLEKCLDYHFPGYW